MASGEWSPVAIRYSLFATRLEVRREFGLPEPRGDFDVVRDLLLEHDARGMKRVDDRQRVGAA